MENSKTVTIVHLIGHLTIGGMENMLSKIVRGYDKSRFNVIICCLGKGGAIADELTKSGYRVEVLHRNKKGFDWKAILAVYRLLKKEQVDILRTHAYHANFYGRVAGILARVPVMVPSFHNVYVSSKSPKITRRVINHILSYFSTALVAVSKSVATDIVTFDHVNPEKVKVIYNGVNIKEFKADISKEAARETFGLPSDRILIGSVGRIMDQKGHRFLIEAASTIENCHLVFAGDGNKIGELKDLTRRLGAGCTFLGSVEPSKIPVFLKALDIFCFPSLWEGMGTALVESMAAGLPVIATDIPPHREVLGSMGILVPPGNSKELNKALTLLMNDSGRRDSLKENISRRADIFSIENTVKAYESLFESCLISKGLL